MAHLRLHYPALILLIGFPCWTLAEKTISRYSVNEGGSVNISCHVEPTAKWELWIIPNGDIVTKLQQSNDTRVSVVDGVLDIHNVQLSDDGMYTCIVYSNNSTIVKSQLEVVPNVIIGDAWGQYGNQFVVGFIAAGSALLIIISGCLVYQFRWRDPKEKKKGDRDALTPAADFDGVIADARF